VADDSLDKYQVTADADALQQHAQITADPDRHAAAHQELQNRATQAKQAVGSSQKSMTGKVKKGLKKAFPSAGSTPFEKSSGNQKTPFDAASEGK
jgi:L,D-peptidoglycan transpeptidase YkuD (ErfK/YbiS/YcfS/YnhG family)